MAKKSESCKCVEQVNSQLASSSAQYQITNFCRPVIADDCLCVLSILRKEKPRMKSAELKKYLREQCNAYRDETREKCEVSHLLRRCPSFVNWESNHCLPALVIHHIAGRSNAESQAFCNLILVNNSAHEWNHQYGGRSYNVNHAFEACCLFAKWKRHHSLEGKTFPIPDRTDRVHWSIEQLDAIRAKCVSCKTIAVRVEVLADSLAGSIFEDVALKLVEAVKHG